MDKFILDLHYNEIPNFEKHKATLMELFLRYGNIPQEQFSQIDEDGQEQMDLFFSAILRTLSFLHKKYDGVDLSKVNIPDKDDLPFLEDHELTVASLYMARLFKNIYSVGFSTKNDSLGVCKLYYGPRLSTKKIEAMIPRFQSALIRNDDRILITDPRSKAQKYLNDKFFSEVVHMDNYGFLITQHMLTNKGIMESFCAGDDSWKDDLFKSILAGKYSKAKLKDPDFMKNFISAIESVGDMIRYAKPILEEKFKDLPRILYEKVMVHELLHSASFVNKESFNAENRDRILKYAKVNDVVSAMLSPIFNVLFVRDFFYETETERIATEIMNSGIIVREIENYKGFWYLIKKQTNSGYSTNDSNMRLMGILAVRKCGGADVHYLTDHDEKEYYEQFPALYQKVLSGPKNKMSPQEIVISRFNLIHRSITDGRKMSASSSRSKHDKGRGMILKGLKETESLQADIVREYNESVLAEFRERCATSSFKGVSPDELLAIREDIEAMGSLLQLGYDFERRTSDTIAIRDSIFGKDSTFRDMTADLPAMQISLLIRAGALAPTENLIEYLSLRQNFEQIENQLFRNDRENFEGVVPSNELDKQNSLFNFISGQDEWL